MSWDEKLFHRAVRAIEGWTGRDRRTGSDFAIELEDCQEWLSRVAAGISGRRVEVLEAEAEGGTSGRRIYLPGRLDLFSSRELNRKLYLWRTLLACALIRTGAFLPKAQEAAGAEHRRAAGIQAIPEALCWLREELPGFEALRREQCRAFLEKWPAPQSSSPRVFQCLALFTDDAAPLSFTQRKDRVSAYPLRASEREWLNRCAIFWGSLMAEEPISTEGEWKAAAAVDPSALSSGSELQSKPRERASAIELGQSESEENPLVHVFEKVQTAEEYKPGNKSKDGSDELSEHRDALEELDLRHVIRGGERAESVLRSDVFLDAGVPDLLSGGEEPSSRAFAYDEWNHSTRSYRRDWCRVHVSQAIPSPGSPGGARDQVRELRQDVCAERQIRHLRSFLEQWVNARSWERRQAEGPEIDLDALVDWKCSVRAGTSPRERLYLDRRRNHADLATVILLDSSLSTDSWVNNQRVLDLELEAIRVLSRVLDGIHEQVEVAAFHSHTRQDCRYSQLKGFDEPWARVGERLGSVEPSGYTRIGPALRHASASLRAQSARRKWILLISDGKPTDYDRYEGSYGIADIHQAIQEARQADIRVRALAVDAQAKSYLPAMLGRGNYQILPNPSRLPGCLIRIYAEVLR